ncbi:unnamed protein product [Clavelina lepadiformis]|uniref:Dynein light chain n=1 Tax=Clavelina lepadiformis TaxID=159417 RepID=A0ABP0G123_CLALP
MRLCAVWGRNTYTRPGTTRVEKADASFISFGILNVLTCLISTFRINIMTTLQRRQGLFLVSGLIPVNSLSFYLSVLAGLLALVGSWIMNMVTFDDAEVRQRLSKTVKQHMARNLMYPDDKRSTKMVTFSSMPSDMEERAAEICVKAVMQFGLEEDIAENIKQTFEAQYGPTWHCAVGANFGSAVHHRINEYIEVSMPQISVLIFRCDEPRTSDLDQTSDSTSPDFR